MTLPLQTTGLGVRWFEGAVRLLTQWFRSPLEGRLAGLAEQFVTTPLPATGHGISRLFTPPPTSDEPWHSIYQSIVGGEVMILALLLLLSCVQGRHFVRIFNLGSAFETRRTSRSAWTGAVLIVGWYWVGLLVLYFVEAFTVVLLPDLTKLGALLVSTLPTALSNPAIALVMTVLGAAAMLCVEAMFFLRYVLLFGYLYLMPIGFAVAFGNLPILSEIASALCRRFIPLAILPLPAALLFRTYDLLFATGYIPLPSAFLRFLVVVSLPMLCLYVSWKTFQYSNPLTARVVYRTASSAATAGVVAGVGATMGPKVGTSIALRGPAFTAGETTARRFAGPTATSRTRGSIGDDGSRHPTDRHSRKQLGRGTGNYPEMGENSDTETESLTAAQAMGDPNSFVKDTTSRAISTHGGRDAPSPAGRTFGRDSPTPPPSEDSSRGQGSDGVHSEPETPRETDGQQNRPERRSGGGPRFDTTRSPGQEEETESEGEPHE